MKNRITIAIAALTLVVTSCSKNEINENTSATNLIGFKNINDRVSARAANDQGSDFGVYAVYHNVAEYGTGWFMNNIVVNGQTNSYSTPKFWPATGTVDFYSYAPANSANIDFSSLAYNNGDDASFTVGYVVANAAQEDFTIAAPQLSQNNKGTGSAVDLAFSHALSQVQFNVVLDGVTLTNDNYTLEVKNVELEVQYDGNTVELNNQTWNNSFTRSAGYAPYSGITNAGYYNILPQSIDAGNVATITVSIKITDNTTGAVYIDGNIKPLVLNGTTGNGFAGFQKGTAYRFSVTIADTSTDGTDTPIFTPISFSSSLAQWNNAGIDL